MHLQEYLGSRRDDCVALFVGKGRRLKKNGIETVIKKLGKRRGWKMPTRTLATNLLDRGTNIQNVAAILGHEDLKTTQVYCYTSQANVKAAYHKYAA